MSLSQPRTTGERPVTKYIKFKNDQFSYYDKTQSKEVSIPLPIRFVKLDELATITGWHDASESGIYSNEVHYTTKEELSVKSFKGGLIAEGIYKDITDKIKSAGGRYTKSLYAMLQGELVNFQIVGASFSSWIELSNQKNLSNTFEVKELGNGKKGKTEYTFPIFVSVPDDEKEIAEATELDITLQAYLDTYKASQIAIKGEQTVIVPRSGASMTPQMLKDEFSETPPSSGIKYESNIKPEDLPF